MSYVKWAFTAQYIPLSKDTINGLAKLTKHTGTDWWFRLMTDENGSCVYDIENECPLSWQKALSDLNDAVIDTPSEYRLNKEELAALIDLFDRYGLKNSLT